MEVDDYMKAWRTKHERDYLAALDLAKVMLDYPKEGEQ